MMNSSSLSSARLLNRIALGMCLLTGGALFVGGMAGLWVGLAGIAVVAACQVGANLKLKKSEAEIERMSQVVSALAKGDFEARLTSITEKGKFGEFQWALNEMVDAVDAFRVRQVPGVEAAAGKGGDAEHAASLPGRAGAATGA